VNSCRLWLRLLREKQGELESQKVGLPDIATRDLRIGGDEGGKRPDGLCTRLRLRLCSHSRGEVRGHTKSRLIWEETGEVGEWGRKKRRFMSRCRRRGQGDLEKKQNGSSHVICKSMFRIK